MPYLCHKVSNCFRRSRRRRIRAETVREREEKPGIGENAFCCVCARVSFVFLCCARFCLFVCSFVSLSHLVCIDRSSASVGQRNQAQEVPCRRRKFSHFCLGNLVGTRATAHPTPRRAVSPAPRRTNIPSPQFTSKFSLCRNSSNPQLC